MPFLYYTLPMPVVSTPGGSVELDDMITAAFGSVPANWQDFWITYYDAAQFVAWNLDYWDPESPQHGYWSLNGTDIGGGLANQEYVSRANLANADLFTGNIIGPYAYVATRIANPDIYMQYSLIAIDPAVMSPTAGLGAPTPQDVVDSANRFATYYGTVVNDNDCHYIAAALAAAAGAVFTDNTQSLVGSENEEYGFWRIAYRGSDPSPVAQWQTLVQPGDIVRMGWVGGGFHTTTVLSVNGNGTITVYDNYNLNINIETVDFDNQTIANTITIYRLTTDGLFLVNGFEASGETLYGSSLFNDHLRGLGGNDTLIGADGNDRLDGGVGNDAMTGGLGNDTYIVDSASDTVTEASGQGTDTVFSSLTHTLAANVENLTLTGISAINGTGNGLDNTIIGNGAANSLTGAGGADTLDGGAGADTMSGGAGNDIYIVDNASDVVAENVAEGTDTIRSGVGVAALAANVENLVLLGAAATGNGNAFANTITGNAANNSINGFAGADTMAGGLGNDTYFVDDLADVVTEAAGQGTDIIFSTVNIAALAANVENLTISGAALSATGNSLNNTIAGNSQNNTLNGGSGEDTLVGGIGNDLYVVNSAGDVVTEALGAGTDSILALINITALAANVENVTLAGTATSATGNELSNILTGNGLNNTLVGGLGNDQLNGGVGADTMSGGAGDDAYLVENAGDVVTELVGEGNNDIVYAFISINALADNVERVTITGAGDLFINGNALANRVNGNAGANTLAGHGGNDVIQGLAGADTLIGGAGLDIMTGGADADMFVFNAVSESGVTGATRDVINDFTQGADLIQLMYMDAITGGGDDAFTFIGTGAFTNTAGQLRYDQIDNASGSDYTIIAMDVNGDGVADSQITLIGLVTLTVSDFGL